MMPSAPLLNQLNLVVQDMDASLAFYRRLGLEISAGPGATHASVTFANGILLELDAPDSVGSWDSGSHGAESGGSVVLGFLVSSREAVDATFDDLTGAGYRGHQPPYDAFWGARYAIIDDPDRHPIGIMSPTDNTLRYWPPKRPPGARI